MYSTVHYSTVQWAHCAVFLIIRVIRVGVRVNIWAGKVGCSILGFLGQGSEELFRAEHGGVG